ncbi:hypothetical protein NA57DRAFT_72847 [Rhizodiscina lignyota]|uniref:Uncharacterized protein n=1 Tax=Rhizodiscina lignyota TaxID=1504668 RepID=A0A9P4IL49_9PEZI|nr:hypothetical protein NA57DRAFT_72847 [Rhizodiscina lignyota]
MSFGFSVGDFIAIAEKAREVYNRCKSGPKRYESLAQHVHFLQKVLEETTTSFKDDTTSSVAGASSLISAQQACRTVLYEVEACLDKYAEMGESNPGVVERIKFAAKDVDGLKDKLSAVALQLNLGLVSHMNLSQARVERALDRFMQKRETTVQLSTGTTQYVSDKISPGISETASKNTNGSGKENRGGSESTLISPPSDVKASADQSRLASNTEAADKPPVSRSIDHHAFSSAEKHSKTRQHMQAEPERKFSPLASYGSYFPTESQHSSDVSSYLNSTDRLPNRVMTESSPTELSEPVDSESTGQTLDVKDLLAPIFQGDLAAKDEEAEVLNRFRRAFRLLKPSQLSCPTSEEVSLLCKELFTETSVPLSERFRFVDRLLPKASAYREINEKTFVYIMQGVRACTIGCRKMFVSENIDKGHQKLLSQELSKLHKEAEAIPPWCFKMSKVGDLQEYYDEISETEVDKRPLIRLKYATFTSANIRARNLLKYLDAVDRWSNEELLKGFGTEITPALQIMRAGLSIFGALGREDKKNLMSDLDQALIEFSFTRKEFLRVSDEELDESKDDLKTELSELSQLLERHSDGYKALEMALQVCDLILKRIQGFLSFLTDIGTHISSPGSNFFPIVRYRHGYVKAGSELMMDVVKQWNQVVANAIFAHRGQKDNHLLNKYAVRFIKGNVERQQKKIHDLSVSPWGGRIISAQVKGYNKEKECTLKVSIDNPRQRKVLPNTKPVRSILSWENIQELPGIVKRGPEYTCIKLLQSSIIIVELRRASNNPFKSKDEKLGQWKWRRNLQSSASFEDRVHGVHTITQEATKGNPYEIQLVFEMDDESRVSDEIKERRKVHWTNALVEDSLIFETYELEQKKVD